MKGREKRKLFLKANHLRYLLLLQLLEWPLQQLLLETLILWRALFVRKPLYSFGILSLADVRFA